MKQSMPTAKLTKADEELMAKLMREHKLEEAVVEAAIEWRTGTDEGQDKLRDAVDELLKERG